jgi:hypothetical protein
MDVYVAHSKRRMMCEHAGADMIVFQKKQKGETISFKSPDEPNNSPTCLANANHRPSACRQIVF